MIRATIRCIIWAGAITCARAETPRERELLERLKAWDGTTDAGRAEPLMFAVWIERVKTRMLADDLGEMMRSFGGVRPELIRTILTTDQGWCDDLATTDAETCEAGGQGQFHAFSDRQSKGPVGSF